MPSVQGQERQAAVLQPGARQQAHDLDVQTGDGVVIMLNVDVNFGERELPPVDGWVRREQDGTATATLKGSRNEVMAVVNELRDRVNVGR